MSQMFYDELSNDYDKLINFNYDSRKEKIRNLLDSIPIAAADIGCGTGIDTIALALMGASVDAFDISKGQLTKAISNAGKLDLNISFIQESVTDIDQTFHNKYDLIVSLGNTLANLNKSQLSNAFNKMSKLLKPNGQLIVQLLNYDRILQDKERIVSINYKHDKCFIRFYDFNIDGTLTFNVLSFNTTSSDKHKLISTTIYPHISSEMKEQLEQNGFADIKFFGSYTKINFEEGESKDLIISASKGTID